MRESEEMLMSSVVGYRKCPRCGGVMSTEFNCKTFEEWAACKRCGRREGWHYARDDEGNVFRDSDGNPIVENDNIEGYGVANLEFDGCGVYWPMLKIGDEELKAAFYEEIANNPYVTKEECYLTVWDDASQTVKAEYGTLPMLFDEFEAIDVDMDEDKDASSTDDPIPF